MQKTEQVVVQRFGLTSDRKVVRWFKFNCARVCLFLGGMDLRTAQNLASELTKQVYDPFSSPLPELAQLALATGRAAPVHQRSLFPRFLLK